MYPKTANRVHIWGMCTRFCEIVTLLLCYNGSSCQASAYRAIEEEVEQLGVDVEVLATDLDFLEKSCPNYLFKALPPLYSLRYCGVRTSSGMSLWNSTLLAMPGLMRRAKMLRL